MADPNISQVPATVWEAVMTKDGPVDNIFTSQNLIGLLGKNGFKEAVGGGRLFEFDIEYATNPSFRSVGELEQLDVTRYDTFDAARYDQKIWAGTVVFSDLEQLRNDLENRKFDLVKRKLLNGSNSALEGLNAMLYGDGQGSGGRDFSGLAQIISSTPTTGVVGGISANTWAFWRNRQNSGAKTAVIYDNLVSATTTTWDQCTLGGTKKIPNGVISDLATQVGYEGRLTQMARIVKDAQGVGDADATFAADAIAFKGKPWIYDETCPANTAYIPNSDVLKLAYLKNGWMKMKDPVEPANQLSVVYRIMTVGNLCCSARRHLGVVTNTAS